jgi:2-polyprenyl-3-methyl-5-hydroxy-6-metoxy-1,4-benzoquinol methylase
MFEENNVEIQRQEKITWQRGSFFKSYENILGSFIVKSVIENMQSGFLLDIACGNGDLTAMMSSFFEKAVALDASKQNLSIAMKNYPDIDYVHGLAEEYQSEYQFNTITMINLLEHVKSPVDVLRSISRNLSCDGVIIAYVPNALAVNRKIAKLMGTLTDEYELSPFDIDIAGHRRSYDLDLLRADFENAGLTIKHVGGVFYKMLSTPQINWLLENGPWEEGGFGWGRVGAEKDKDWRKAFCDACYEYGKERPSDCNVIYAVGALN